MYNGKLEAKEEGDFLDSAIGVIDSGVGGLTVAHELMRQLPKEKLIYLGDTARCPYGSRPKQDVIKFTKEMVDFLLGKNIKMLVIACNTATAYTLDELQESLDIPVVGVIQPGARAAIKSTINNYIGIIGTKGTIRSGAYPEALKNINMNIHVEQQACPQFVPLVEQGIVTGDTAYKTVASSLQSIKDNQRIDTLILGCTHYPLMKDLIQTVVGSNVTLISSGEETAREVSTILGFHDLLSKEERVPGHQFYATGNLEMFSGIAKNIFHVSNTDFRSVVIEKASIG